MSHVPALALLLLHFQLIRSAYLLVHFSYLFFCVRYLEGERKTNKQNSLHFNAPKGSHPAAATTNSLSPSKPDTVLASVVSSYQQQLKARNSVSATQTKTTSVRGNPSITLGKILVLCSLALCWPLESSWDRTSHELGPASELQAVHIFLMVSCRCIIVSFLIADQTPDKRQFQEAHRGHSPPWQQENEAACSQRGRSGSR